MYPPTIASKDATVVGDSPLSEQKRRICLAVLAGVPFALARVMAAAKCFVYVLRSQRHPGRHYVGLTSNMQARLAVHNTGHCKHTATGTPWETVVVIEFADNERAVAFEKYLKSGSGVVFAQRHFR